MATIGRGAAVVQMLGGRTMKGHKAQFAWRTRAPRAPPDERGPCEGDRRLGRQPGSHTSARAGSASTRTSRPRNGRPSVPAATSATQRRSRGDRLQRAKRTPSRGRPTSSSIFGITGDLAKVMTFRSLYRLEQRGLLDCPIVGVAVDDWTRRPARASAPATSIVGTGEQLDEEVFDAVRRRGSRTCRATSRDAATYERVGDGDRGRRDARSSTSRSRRSCSARSSRAWPRPA